MEVVDLVSSDSEDEVCVYSPERKRPAWEANAYSDLGGGGSRARIGDHAAGSILEPPRTVRSLHQPSEFSKKDKEKVAEGESAWAAGVKLLGGESCGARGRISGAGWDTWSTKIKSVNGGNEGVQCSWGSQIGRSISLPKEESSSRGFHGRYYGKHALLHHDSVSSGDDWQPYLGAKPTDRPVNTLLHSWDAGRRENGIAMCGQSSSAIPDILKEDYSSSTWLSNIEGLHFPLPDQNQLKARQIESDEMFARMLQEQFNQEQPGSQNSAEVDTTIAWTLQEDDAARARISARESQSSSSQRDRSMGHLYSYGQRSPVQSFPVSNRMLSRNSRCPDRTQQNMIISQLANGCFTEDMDFDTRMAVMNSLQEALETYGDPLPSDSDDDDYENLVMLDVNNHHRGASDDQLDSLPLFAAEEDSCRDYLCPICLDSPVDGALVRRLPCLHKFHKECIEKWLRKKILCPVCKSNVF